MFPITSKDIYLALSELTSACLCKQKEEFDDISSIDVANLLEANRLYMRTINYDDGCEWFGRRTAVLAYVGSVLSQLPPDFLEDFYREHDKEVEIMFTNLIDLYRHYILQLN